MLSYMLSIASQSECYKNGKMNGAPEGKLIFLHSATTVIVLIHRYCFLALFKQVKCIL